MKQPLPRLVGGWERLIEWIARQPRPERALAAIGALLILPGLFGGWVMDDRLMWLAVRGVGDELGMQRAPWDLFTFVPSAGPQRELLDATGIGPWWTSPDLALTFFRPITSLSIALDVWLAPHAAAWAHLVNIAWYAALVAVVTRLLLDVVADRRVALGAALLYALDDAHSLGASWIANRNAAIAMVFGLLSVRAHTAWRTSGRAAQGIWAVVWLLAGLLSGEMAVCAAGFTVAWAATMDPAGWRSRALSLVPATLAIVGWRVGYNIAGYGTHHSALYVDPGHSPLEFAGAVVERVPVLLAAVFTPLSCDSWLILPAALAPVWVAVAVVVSLALAALFAPLVRERAEARFAAVGAVLTLVPVAATFPNDRLLFASGIGAMLLVSMWIDRAVLRPADGATCRPGRGARTVAVLLLATHLVLAPALKPPRSLTPTLFGALSDHAAATVSASLGGVATERVLVLHTTDLFLSNFVAYWQRFRGLPEVATVRVLVPSAGRVVLDRPDPAVLRATIDGGGMPQAIDWLVRDGAARFAPGDRIAHNELRIAVEAVTPDGRPAVLRFELTDGSAWEDWPAVDMTSRGYARVTLPLPGQRRVLEPIDRVALLRAAFANPVRP